MEACCPGDRLGSTCSGQAGLGTQARLKCKNRKFRGVFWREGCNDFKYPSCSKTAET